MHSSAIHDPYANATPSERLFADAHRKRLAKIAAGACPIILRAPSAASDPELPKVESEQEWADRQRRIPLPKEPWFSIVEEIEPAEPRRPTVNDIQRAVARHYGVTRLDILSARRAVNIVRPRQVGYFLSKRLTLNSLPQIARRFGDRDHTSVLSGIKKIERLLNEDAPGLAQDIQTIKQTLSATL